MAWISNQNKAFRLKFSEDIFNQKYNHGRPTPFTWDELCAVLVEDVCGDLMPKDEKDQLTKYMQEMKFLAGGRYIYYAGRARRFYNNCYIFRSLEDSKENWADLSWKAESALTTGGGIGNDYSVYRAEGSPIHGSGGFASGPVSKADMINEIGRRVMQGGSRRSAIYASLNCDHPDAMKWVYAKDWKNMPVGTTGYSLWDIKQQDFNFPAPFDMTNMSLNMNTAWLEHYKATGEVGDVFMASVKQALMTGEPGWSFNFYDKENETGRNACTEVTSADDGDVCNLGSVNMSRISTVAEFADVVALGTKFLICGTITGQVPIELIRKVREKNRRLGLGLMGMHEWLLARNDKYEVTPEMHEWLGVYRDVSDRVSAAFADQLGVSRPVAKRAIAPTGTIGIMAGTTTGIEPLFAVAYKRRYLKNKEWHYQYVVDGTAQIMIDQYGLDPNKIESAADLTYDFERRLRFQADVQDYVDMSISSTINLPAWGTEHNNESLVKPFAEKLASYAHRLRGFTVYPDGARGGQPLTQVPYEEAVSNLGTEFKETVEFADACKGGVCGL